MLQPARDESDFPPDLRALGTRIREAREALGWTQQQLADGVRMSRTTVVAIEKGQRKLKPAELVQLANLLGRNISEFLQRGHPAEGVADHLRGTLPLAGVSAEEVLPHIEELRRLCEDYVHLESLCQA